jgi:hypothetical protein
MPEIRLGEPMNRPLAHLVLAAVLSTAHHAAAQIVPTTNEEEPGEPPGASPERGADDEAAERSAEHRSVLGYQAELGVATTHIWQGAWQYTTKSTPATEDYAGLRLKFGRYGTVAAGVGATAALSSFSRQPDEGMELLPTIAHGIHLAPLHVTTGFRVLLFPRAELVDRKYEGFVEVSVPSAYVTPVFEVSPEVVRERGVYAFAGAEHKFTRGRLTVTPHAHFGIQGYEEESERLHPNEVMVTVPAKWTIGEGFYAILKPGYSVLVGPDHDYKDRSFAGRSLAFALFSFGAEL